MKYNSQSRNALKNYFPLPNEIFSLGLYSGEISVYGNAYYYPTAEYIGATQKPKGKGCKRMDLPEFCEPEKPMTPDKAYAHLKILLKKAGLPSIRFHDLRHTFATMALEYGMDVKTLSVTIGHMSAKTTLNVYSHITDTMREQAAVKIDRSIGGTDAKIPRAESKSGTMEKTLFQLYKPKIRKAGTGCISKLSEHLYEGRYSPSVGGKRISRNIYAKTRKECEEKLAELIKQMKSELKI